jgi:hypothetical protein
MQLNISTSSAPPSEVPSSSQHAESLHERLSVVHQEVQSHKSRKSNQQRASLEECIHTLHGFKIQFHDIEERIALQATDHRGELNLLENFIREALFKVEQTIIADSDRQYELFAENISVVEEKIREIEVTVFNSTTGGLLHSEEEQIGMIRQEMTAAVEAARLLCEVEEDTADQELAELIEPGKMKIRNLAELADIEFRAVERIVEDSRGQLLALTAPPGGSTTTRLEQKQREIAKGLKEIRQGLQTIRQERELTFATLYDAMTQLSNEMIKRADQQQQ